MEGVLVAAVCKTGKLQSSSSSGLQTPLSGSGFLLQLDERSGNSSNHNGGMLVTSASWLADLLQLDIITLSRSEVRWSYKDCKQDDVQFIVLMSDGSNKPCDSTLSYQTGHVIKRAEFVGVYLIPSVYTSLDQQLSLLSNWRVAIGGDKEKQKETFGSQNDDSISSLLLHLACVAVLKFTDKSSYVRSSFPLSCSTQKHQVGDMVHIVGTPFGSFCPEVFFNSLLSGCVCKLLNSDGAIFITDARVLPGCEGAPVFDRHHQLSGMVVTGLSTTDGHHAGLALACSIGTVIEALEGYFNISNRLLLPGTLHTVQNEKQLHTEMLPLEPSLLSLLSATVVMVTTKDSWGSGIRLTPSLVLTCQHVVKSSRGCINATGVPATVHSPGEVIFASSLPDIALIKITNHHHRKDTPLHNQPPNSTQSLFNAHQMTETGFLANNKYMCTCNSNSNVTKGTEVCIIGYGFENPLDTVDRSDGSSTRVCTSDQSKPLVTKGRILNVIGYEDDVVMFVMSAVVHPGMSGGLVVNGNSGEPLGMVVSYSRDKETDTVYPSVNYCLPLSIVLPSLKVFMTTGDTSQLHILASRWKKVSYLWELRTQLDIPGCFSERTILSKL